LRKNQTFSTTDRSLALELDTADPLSRFRDRFYIPPGKIYVDGNSLGLLSRDAEESLQRVAEEWKHLAIGGWMGAKHPWIYFAERLGAGLSELVGARPDEVVVTGTTTVNLHALVSTFYHPDGRRTRILADELTFPTDIYALRSQVALHGLDPDIHFLQVPSADARILDEERIIDAMDEAVMVAVLPSVLYRSGQLLDMKRLTEEAHRRGILIGFDCSHSVGVLPHRLDDWDVDFAFWCSYKYLNGGPGCPACLYLNERHFGREPALPGWFGYVKERQFDLLPSFEHQRSAGGWQISSPGILGAAPIEGSLGIIHEAGIDAIREKSLRMTSYLMYLIDHRLAAGTSAFGIGTPGEPQRRGGHVALEHTHAARAVFDALTSRGVIGDFRSPNVIRIAPSPLYNSYDDVWLVVDQLTQIAKLLG
jgi:kynureninase